MNRNSQNPTNRSVTLVCRAELRHQHLQTKMSVLTILICAVLSHTPAFAAFTPEVINSVVTGEALDTGDVQNIGMGVLPKRPPLVVHVCLLESKMSTRVAQPTAPRLIIMGSRVSTWEGYPMTL